MKIIKIIFFTLLAVSLVVCTGVFIFFQTFDTDKYLPQITRKASFVLGRPVSIGHVGLGLSQRGITLDAWPLVIADDENFTSQPFIKVDRIRISLDLRSLVLQRKIHVTQILLQSPQIHFIRSQEGDINVHSIGQAASLPSGNTVMASPKSKAVPSSHVPHNGIFPAVNIKSIKIQDASISFINQSHGMPLDIWLTHINATLNDFSLSKPFQLSFEASPLVFKATSPGAMDSPFFKNISGHVQLDLSPLQLSAPGDIKANGDIFITGGVIKNFNIIKTVLSRALEGFGGDIEKLLNGRLKDLLGREDTYVERAEAGFSIHDRAVFIDNFLIKTNILEFTAQGSMDQGLNMDMQTMLRLNNDVSTALVKEIEGLKFLCDGSKRIAIGASLKGIIPHLKYKPNKNFKKKSKKFFFAEGGNILGALLGGR